MQSTCCIGKKGQAGCFWLSQLAGAFASRILTAYFNFIHHLSQGSKALLAFPQCHRACPILTNKQPYTVYTLPRYFRRSTTDAYLAEVFGYVKLATVTVLAAADYRLGVYMALWVLLSSLLFIQPRFSGEQNVNVMTPASFDSQALSETSQAVWLVMLTAPWSTQSRHAQATFAELSLEYTSEKLKFGELDAGRWPKVAKKFDMSIDANPNQLPAFLLLKRGKLIKRMPEADRSWERKGRLKALLVNHFDLDMVLASSLLQ